MAAKHASEGLMSKILIIGASSGVGLEAVKAVRAFARSAANIAIADPNLERFPGSALNGKDVSAALADVDAVILALGIPLGAQMLLGPVRLFSEATRVLIPAMEAAGVKRLVCVTGFGAGDSHSSIGRLQGLGFRLVFGRAYADKDTQESLIRQSRLEWVIARPGILTNGPGTRRYKTLEAPGSWRNGVISRTDVADFLVTALDGNAWVGKTPVLIG